MLYSFIKGILIDEKYNNDKALALLINAKLVKNQ